jgi:anti-anti-sigma factor
MRSTTRFGWRGWGYDVEVIEICHETVGRPPVVFVDMQLDSSRDLVRLLGTAVSAGGVSLVVDMGDRTEASSELLSILHRTAHHVRELGGRLGVVSPQPSLRRLFELTLLSQAFAVFATREEAVQSWS